MGTMIGSQRQNHSAGFNVKAALTVRGGLKEGETILRSDQFEGRPNQTKEFSADEKIDRQIFLKFVGLILCCGISGDGMAPRCNQRAVTIPLQGI